MLIDMEAEEVQYKNLECGEILMELAKSEYENEHKRTRIIDTKTNISLVTVTAYFFAIASFVHYKEILKISVTSISEAVCPLLQLVLIGAAFILVTASIVCFMCVILTHPYDVLDATYFGDLEALMFDRGVYALGLVEKYIEATNNNQNSNNKRAEIYKRGVVCAIISIILFALYIIIRG